MQKVSDTTGSDSDDIVECEDSDSKEVTGWEDEIPDLRKVNKVNLIKVVNDKFSLSHFIGNLKFEEKYSPSGWTHKTTCPFPDHRDSSPSFFYNPKEGIFNCFGCSRGGKVVEYISYLRNISKIAAAELIFKKLNNHFSLEDIVKNDFSTEIDDALIRFSNSIREYLVKHPDSLKQVEYLTWSLDVYLTKYTSKNEIKPEMLNRRINSILKKLT